jgi:Hemerythrin HHE cation binding domain
MAQHRLLRGMMTRCEAFADELEAGRCGPMQLMREVSRLRLAFDSHNKFEEEMLRPVLLAHLPAAAIQLEIEEHVDAHSQMRSALATDETAMLREVIDAMRRHLDGEERYLHSALALGAAVVE